MPPRRITRIPAGPVAAALNHLADKSGAQLVYDAGLAREVMTRGLKGRHTLDDALNKLLSGTGLAYRLAPNGSTVAIMLAQNDAGTQSDAGAVALPAIDVAGAAGPGAGAGAVGVGSDATCGVYGGAPCGGFGGAGLAQDPFNPSYVLPDASVGTKTNTPVMETPLNVQSISQQVLQDQQVITLDQALQNVSGVTTAEGPAENGSPFQELVLRGFPTNNIYLDGFRLDGGANSTTQFANVASIEVLKGPAAILYGLSEPGGLVNIVTKEPLNAPYYSAQQQVGSFANYRTSLDATGPLTDDNAWLYRMNMSYQSNGAPFGYFVDSTDQQTLFLAPVLKWNIDGATWIKLQAQYNSTHLSGYFSSAPVYDGVLVPIPRSWNYGNSSPGTSNTLFTALTWSHQFNNDWSIRQQIAYDRADSDVNARQQFTYFIDTSGSAPAWDRNITLNYYGQTTYSTNVDITGHINAFDTSHTLLVGGDFYKFNQYSLYTGGPISSPIDVFNPVHPGLPFLGPVLPAGENYIPQDTAGLYVQDQIKLPYNFFALVGARYQYVRENGGLASNSTFAADTTIKDAQTAQALTPRFGLLWRPQDWVSFYTSYTEGFGANSGIIYPNKPVPPTSATDAEAGIKLELLGGKLRVTADYYDLTKTNVQEADPFHPLGNYSLVTGAERSRGPELDIQGELLPGWNVILAYTNQDVRITKTLPGAVTGALGQRVALTPQNLGSFWTTYDFQDDTFRGLKIGGGVVYHGSELAQDLSGNNLSPFLPKISGYATINLMSAYSFNLADTKMTAQVNVTNLLDTTYYTDAIYFSPFTPGLTAGAHTYGAPFSIIGSLSAQLPAKAPSVTAGSAPQAFSPPPAFTWTGAYAGAQIGFAWGYNSGDLQFVTPGGLAGANRFTSAAQGAIGGAHVGYNYQIDHWVTGLEGAIDGLNLNKNALLTYADPLTLSDGYANQGATLAGSLSSGIQGSIRARAGYAFDRLLVYGTAGVAFAGVKSRLGFSVGDASGVYYATDGRSGMRTGWTAGGGVEYAINNNWSVRGEYRFSDFGRLTDAPEYSVAGLSYTANRQLNQNQVQAGFSYKFDSFDQAAANRAEPAMFDFSQLRFSQIAPPPAAVAPAASAGPLSPPPSGPVNWTGFDLGFQAGFAWGHSGLGFAGYDSFAASAVTNSVISSHYGAIGGAHAGYNYQIGQFVVGVEGSVDLTSSLYEANFPGAFGGSSVLASTPSYVQGSIRGRFGYAFDRALIYATAGFATGDVKTAYQLSGNNSQNGGINAGNIVYGSNLFTNFPVGWTAGGGVEYAITDQWSVRGEYRYTSFGMISNAFIDSGSLSLTPGLSGSSLSANRRLDQNLVEAGFSYKFDFGNAAPVIAKY